MQAVTYSRYGTPEVLQLSEIPRPQPAAQEVLIRVRAVEVTKADCEIRAFSFPAKWSRLPMRLVFGITKPRRRVPGMYFSGEVVECGSAVQGLVAGDRVFGTTGLRLGACAEFVACPAANALVKMPSNMTFAEAAAVPLGGFNALHFLRLAKVLRGESVLINGAGGSIGAHALQIARSMGAHVTCVDRADKEAGLRQMGADDFIDYRTQRFTELGETWDVIFDMVYGNDFPACMAVLNPAGRYISGNPSLGIMLRSVVGNRSSDKRAIFAFAAEKREELETLRTMIENDALSSIVHRVLPLKDVAEAHRLVEAEQRVGAIVLEIP